MKINTDHYLTGLADGMYDDSIGTPNLYQFKEFKSASAPDSIIIHYTAMKSASSAVKVLANPETKASAHLVIAKDGKIHQLAPFNYRTWHAGVSQYNGRSSYNNFSIGIEIDNLGWLNKRNDGTYFRSDIGELEADRKVFKGRHWNPKVSKNYWEAYTEEQVASVIEVCKALKFAYGIREILGHDEIAPDRKQDPGPAFPMLEVRKEVFNEEFSDRSIESLSQGEVTASKLNIRDSANGNAKTIADPLQKGQSVEIIEEKDGWYKVKVEIEGWVSKEYVGLK